MYWGSSGCPITRTIFEFRAEDSLATSAEQPVSLKWAQDAQFNKWITLPRFVFDYDELNRLVTVHQGQEGVDPASYPLAAYGYDEIGNLAGTSYINQITHGYDRLHRLTGESIAGATLLPTGQILYTYDAVGNRTSRSTSGSVASRLPTQNHNFTPNDQLNHHSYDANGNTVSSPVSDHCIGDEFPFASTRQGGPSGLARGRMVRACENLAQGALPQRILSIFMIKGKSRFIPCRPNTPVAP